MTKKWRFSLVELTLGRLKDDRGGDHILKLQTEISILGNSRSDERKIPEWGSKHVKIVDLFRVWLK